MTEAGLNTVNLSQMNTFQQFILFMLILLGSAIWVSIAVIHVRRKAFEFRFKSIVEEERQQRRNRSTSRRRLSLPGSRPRSRPTVDGVVARGRVTTSEKDTAEEADLHLSRSNDQPQPDGNTSPSTRHSPKPKPGAKDLEADNSGFDPAQAGQPLSIDTGMTRRITFASPSSPTIERQHGRILSMQRARPGNAESSPLPEGFLGRDFQFSNLSLAEREKIGGVEYRAVTYLAVIVPLYFVLWQLLGCIGLGAYVASNRASTTEANAENPWYARNTCLVLLDTRQLTPFQVGWRFQRSFRFQQQRAEFARCQYVRSLKLSRPLS